MIKTIIFLIFLYFVNCNLQTIEFYESGEYTLSKQDYGNSENIIIEMWGAGSGCTVICNSNDCFYDENNYAYYSGNSGAYLKANIITNGETLNITIGSGGKSCVPPIEEHKYYECYAKKGGSTILNINNINLITEGGKHGYCEPANIMVDVSEYVYIFYSASGNCGSTVTNMNIPGANSTNGYLINETPGYGANCVMNDNNPKPGSDGGIIIYFGSVLTPSVTATITPSISLSATNTKTTSPTNSISITPTISFTISITPSITTTSSITPSISLTVSNSVTKSFTPSISISPTGTVKLGTQLSNDYPLIFLIICVLLLCVLFQLCCICITFPLVCLKFYFPLYLKKIYATEFGECAICYSEQKVFKCKYDHFICIECCSKISKLECSLNHPLLKK